MKKLLIFILAACLLAGCAAPVGVAESTPTPALTAGEAQEAGTGTEAGAAPASEQAEATAAPTPAQLQRDLYEFTLELDDKTHTFTGKMLLNYLNEEDEELYSVYINLYANRAAAGALKIKSAALNGTSVNYTLGGLNESVLSIPLTKELQPGESASIFVEFTLTVPERSAVFGYDSVGYMLGNCLPVAAVYENGGWRTEDYSDIGDYTYSDIADYNVLITAPGTYTTAATGGIKEQTLSGSTTDTLYCAPQVRGFAAALIKNAVSIQASGGSPAVTCYAQKGFTEHEAQRTADDALKCVNVCSMLYGSYPYNELSVVVYNGQYGMEFPGLIMISREQIEESDLYHMYMIAHEVAHQWWYAVVGSDQVNAPWLDESLCEYTSYACISAILGGNSAAELRALDAEAYANVAVTGIPVNAPLSAFQNAGQYYKKVYFDGSMMLEELHDRIGEQAFYEGLSTYYNTHRYSFGTQESLIAAFSEAAGEELSGWFEDNF